MKPLRCFLALLASTVAATAADPKLLWETIGLSAPESVVHDPARNEYYVSNMADHSPTAPAGDGFVSRVSEDGKLLQLKWATGLDNPKGLTLANGHLYVGDDRDLVEIDLPSGRILSRYAPSDGPGNFNDCTADAAGNVYVCSGRLLTVFRLHEGKFAPWIKLDRAVTGGINGLLAENDRLLLGGWSLVDSAGKEQLGHLSAVAFSDQAVSRIGSDPVCHIDGLERDGRGGYVVTDWLTGDVLQVSAEGKSTPIMQLVQGSADHTYRIDTHQLIVPLMKDNVLRAYEWAPTAAN
jgi:hypothetical protein